MHIHLTPDLLETVRTFITTLSAEMPVSELLRIRQDIATPMACMLSGLVMAQDDLVKASDKQSKTSLIDNILDNKPLKLNPLLVDWEIEFGEFKGDYHYPCADDCGYNSIVQDPYHFDPSNHTCGPNGCVAEKIIVISKGT